VAVSGGFRVLRRRIGCLTSEKRGARKNQNIFTVFTPEVDHVPDHVNMGGLGRPILGSDECWDVAGPKKRPSRITPPTEMGVDDQNASVM